MRITKLNLDAGRGCEIHVSGKFASLDALMIIKGGHAVSIWYTSRTTYRLRQRMISRLDSTSITRRFTWAFVHSSRYKRTSTQAYRAAFVWRLPPRLSRGRVALPKEVGTGHAPQNMAKLDAKPSRYGLSPAMTRSCATMPTPTPCRAKRVGANSWTSLVMN